ncbi:MAG: rubredoxin [Planctomycetota bacterium]|jgi:rubredoxin/mono/diheme cytochrome c family protein
MARYECSVCSYVYDESEEGTPWDELADDWVCPICGSAKSFFRRVGTEVEGPAKGGPQRLILAHRVFGYVFVVTYLFFLWQMLPRLWTYQIEFPARTVAHITLGMAIGAILVLKILIVRFFRRLDASLVPTLGSGLLVGSVVLIGISAPFAFQEAMMQRASGAEGLFALDNRQRVRTLLAQTGLDEATCEELASPASLRAGRDVLRRQCIECHDLRTVLAKPRTPESWKQTVRRMADRTTLLNPLDETEQMQVTAYLIALSPQLQQSTRKLRAQEKLTEQAKQAAEAATQPNAAPAAFDPDRAKRLFETKCSDCHKPSLVQTAPLATSDDARSLVGQMVEQGLTATEDELSQIIQYLTRTYVEGSPK